NRPTNVVATTRGTCPRCDPNRLSKVFGGSRHPRDVSCNVRALTRLPWPCALLLGRKLAAFAIGRFPRGENCLPRPRFHHRPHPQFHWPEPEGRQTFHRHGFRP